MRGKLIMCGLVLLAASFAGCTGDFQVRQTEPLRAEIVVIDGDSKSSTVSQTGEGGGDDTAEFKIETTEQTETISVVVECKKVETTETTSPMPTGNTTTSPSPTDTTTTSSVVTNQTTIILVQIIDRDTNETLEEEEVEVQNQTAEINLDIDVRGRNNVVVVTQALQGSAEVTVEANSETGRGGIEDDDNETAEDET